MIFKKAWILLSLMLGLSLVGSIALNRMLFRQAKKYYVESNATRLDPVGLRRFSAESRSNLEEGRSRLVLFGDSRAVAWKIPSLEVMSNYAVINRGISSQTSVQVLNRFDAHVRPLQPDIIVLQVGINDLKTVALFPDQREQIVADCKRNIAQIVDESKALGATVIVSTIFPVGDVPLQRRTVWSDDIEPAILDVNDYIATLADDDVMVLDAFALLKDERGKMRSPYQRDELHVTQAAYDILNQSLLKHLSQLSTR